MTDFDLGDVGRAAHDWTVERTSSYLASCSGVRVFGGAGRELAVGWIKGVEVEPSTVGFEFAAEWLTAVTRPLASLSWPMSSCTRVSCSMAYAIPLPRMSCETCLYSDQSIMGIQLGIQLGPQLAARSMAERWLDKVVSPSTSSLKLRAKTPRS